MSQIRPKSLKQLICYVIALLCFVQAGRVVVLPQAGVPVEASVAEARYVEVPIEQVQAGDWVVSRNDQTGELTSQPVAQSFRRMSDHLRLVIIESPVTGERQVIETTNEHPFWVTGSGWVQASDLQAGDPLQDVDGQALVVLGTKYEPHPEGMPVYNFEVTDTHTYFVKSPEARGPPIWVHNAKCVTFNSDFVSMADFEAMSAEMLGRNAPNSTVKNFDVVDYRPSNPPFENHHGVLDVWAKHNIDDYVSRGTRTPTVALTKTQHEATRKVYRDWLFEQTGKRVGGRVDWSKVSPQEMQRLTERMFDAASVPDAARREYYQAFHQYIYRSN